MSFVRRTFPEILDNLLTDLTGGVAAEAQPFPPPGATAPPYQNSLGQPPVASVISVWGSRDGQSYLFRAGTDYTLLPDNQTLLWQDEKKGGHLPDAGSLLHVNYYPASARRTLTDLQVGSIVRTLAESAALEIGRLYAQLDEVYNAAFLDTATGSALDHVVALLDLTRIRAGRPSGEVELVRAPNSLGEISIPSGTRVTTADAKIQYETIGSVVMAPAQNTVQVIARDLQPNPPLPAGALSLLPAPIAGIASVSNPAPTAVSSQDETDDELRSRARSFLHGSERATLGAIQAAIALQGLKADVVEVADTPGLVLVTPRVDQLPPDTLQRLLQAIEDVRPAGVRVLLQTPRPPAKVALQLRLTTASTLLEADRRAIQRGIHDQLADFFNRLPADQDASINKLSALILGVAGVEDARFLGATADGANVLDLANGVLRLAGSPSVLDRLSIADPSLPTQLNAVVTYPPAQSPPDQAAIQAALNAALAYLNNLTGATPAPDPAKLLLSYGKLLLVTPLPNHPGGSLASFDQTGTPALPTEATCAPYQAQYVLTQASGLSQILAAAADPPYQLSPFERLTLAGVEVKPNA